MEAVALHRVGFLEYFCPKQGQDFKHSAAPLYPNIGRVPPPPPGYTGSCPGEFLSHPIPSPEGNERKATPSTANKAFSVSRN